MSIISKILITVIVYYPTVFIIPFILSKLIPAIYLKYTGYERWYLALVPFLNSVYRNELAGVHIVLSIVNSLLFGVAVISCNVILIVLWLAVNALCDYRFSYVYCDNCNPKIYSFIPFAKYIIMLMEVYKCKK